jgi:thiamine pyrophosphate-dependent acetolactate synthase large subunit-like protein
VGISGGFASPLAAELLRRADVVLAVGASLNMWTTRHGELLSEAAVVQVDLDSDVLGRHRRVDVGIVGDAARTARALEQELARRDVRRTGWRSNDLARRIAEHRWRDEPYDDLSTISRVDPRTLSIALDEMLPAERVVATDSGHFMGFPAMYLSVPDPRAFVFTQAYQSVGLGLSSALGAAVAHPDRLTVAALGDGGALMSLPEFETAARLGPPLLAVVYNDAAYGAEVHHFAPMGEPVDLARFPDTDFAALARAAGGAGCTVRTRADLAALVPWLDQPRGLYVVDAKVTADFAAAWLEEAFRPH